jgi:S1-C subfamily serine protease
VSTPQPIWISIRQSLGGPVGWLVLLNVIVFGFLLARMLASLLFGPTASALLLDGLNNQINRLEVISTGPCDSTGMQQFQRGEIGPIPSILDSQTPFTTIPNSQAPEEDPGPATTSPVPTGQMLNPDGLRSLVQRSVVFVSAGEFTGTGFAISPNLVVTNRHVIENVVSGNVTVASNFLGAPPVPAKVLFATPDSEFGNPDFAVLELQSGRPLEPLSLGSDPKPLDNVLAAGFPGLTISSDVDTVSPDVVFSQGEVSVVQPRSSEVSLVIHTANFAPGSSGGPLINRCGTVVGVNTFLQAGTEFEGRALYSLSSVALVSFLSSVGVPFQYVPSECVSGGG